ncbi:hypothetical protein A3D00_00895 [Candidatus Woesebacteria bacterium RIFCSPHIGHO2_02_FULL_38_9]|uniref:Glycosyltransferase RgtA/B/C/D-like domain-containing protein n=1 Tax=Candidatus Woesebacteria bacterium RIFCSPHIGHO2_01_FULL_39_28 TaxID=1802496 RepID=A0A1F7YGA8_9BACT|nr:MAG: hypothetical protein A2627_02225 [Candidatus Woesebacteria bacterium RIFCSPHIGHO2_01_FULL_39_28]OGM31414.1 MAG: hypothetical protein A3D00_00895 [Candidatus Woesebacteria bacterium RIFCSPHIGHO2_02_FULL_38_9]OGM58152.1 MAG: hypothetical protein A3A50_00105 [Candidatus Woesebacteria bacterium RIFCSPLOWO2_01_FULL_38_20]
MAKKLKNSWKLLVKEVRNHRLVYLLLFIILALAFFVRVYRVDQVLGFYYDQGRDALVIWDLWHKGNFFLIGPTTGIAGIFRGPFYYYLIAPLYLLGNGNPVWPSVFLAYLSVLAIVMIYFLGAKIQNRTTGIIAAVLASFSYYIVYTSRWLSNPSPMFLLSMILVWMMFLVLEGKKYAWVMIALISGLSLFHFGSSGEFFYLPAILVFAIWTIRRQGYGGRSGLNNKTVFVSILVFLLTLAPLVIFNFKHGGILHKNVGKFLFTDKSFTTPTWRFISDKLAFYYDVFTNKLFHSQYEKEKIILGMLSFVFVYFLARLSKNDKVKIILLLLISPIIGFIFFQGNFGNVYDYYFTGYYLIFLLLVAVTLGFLWKTNLFGKVLVCYFLFLFLQNNISVVRNMITDKADDEISIAFVNQKKAIDWVFNDAKSTSFNVDVYVPPVIPYAYDYLFLWLGNSKYGRQPSSERVSLLYTLYEADPPHPERLKSWLARQKGIGKIEKEAKFGGITVQRRVRMY